MAETTAALDDMAARFQGLVDRLHGHACTIGDELGRPPPVQASRITAARHAVTHEIRQFFQFLPDFTRAHFAQAEATPTSAGERRIIPSDWLAMNTRVGLMRGWLDNWPRVQALIERQVPSTPLPLYPDTRRIDPALAAQIAASDAQFERLHSHLTAAEQDEGAREMGCYRDIGLANSAFLAHVHAARRVLLAQGKASGARFLDVGCGGGLKLLAAEDFFDHVTGIELDPGYAGAAEALVAQVAHGGVEVIHGDALEFDGFEAFDVVYFFRPMRHLESLTRLEQRIVEAVRPGTVLIAPYDQFDFRAEALGCARIEGRLFLAHSTPVEADELRRQAEFIGTSPPGKPDDLPGIWEPILAASRRRGYIL